MDLKDFISDALTQITEGIVDAQNRTKAHGAVINPPLAKNGDSSILNHGNKINFVHQTVSFDVTIAVEHNSTLDGEGKLIVAVFKAGGGATRESKDASTSRISFAIPVVWPPAVEPKAPSKKKSEPYFEEDYQKRMF